MDELEVFSAAREISSLEDRARFLDEACGDDVPLRRGSRPCSHPGTRWAISSARLLRI